MQVSRIAAIVLTIALAALVSGEELSIRLPILLRNDKPGRIVWNCDFTADECQITNQYNFGSQFRVHQSATPIAGKQNYYSLEMLKSRGGRGAARLQTPYIPAANHTDGCFGIEYVFTGAAACKLSLWQQSGRQNKCVWRTVNLNGKSDGQWRTATIGIDFRRGNPRLFIDAAVDRLAKDGSIAIGSLWLHYGQCADNNANYCA